MRKIIWSLIIIALMALTALPTVMLIGFGMLPGIVAWIIDRTEEKYATFCVGGFNSCGVFPYLIDLWRQDHTIRQASGILTDVFSLAVMYGGASFGWALYMTLPPVISSFIMVMAERRLTDLRDAQRRTIEEWGDEVIADADFSGHEDRDIRAAA
ncbi:MAG: acyl-CoA synthetase [Proteobacteria bacterium]|nr:acyl-CoA synthetase [Pseudomonadota bacterium]